MGTLAEFGLSHAAPFDRLKAGSSGLESERLPQLRNGNQNGASLRGQPRAAVPTFTLLRWLHIREQCGNHFGGP